MGNQKKTTPKSSSKVQAKPQGVTTVATKLPPSELEALHKLSEITGKTQGRLMREAIRFFVGVRLAGFSIEEDPAVQLSQAARMFAPIKQLGIFNQLADQFEEITGWNPMSDADPLTRKILSEVENDPELAAAAEAMAKQLTHQATSKGTAA